MMGGNVTLDFSLLVLQYNTTNLIVLLFRIKKNNSLDCKNSL